jgi:invasion protein IalB
MRIAVALLAGVLLAAPAAARDGVWFSHRFGELRAYFGDWLAVCANDGMGPCRAVQIVLEGDETRVGPSRLALLRGDDGDYAIAVFDQGMPSAGLAPVAFVFDGVPVTLDAADWQPGEPGFPNALESLAITDPAVTADLLARMRAGNRLTVRYTGGEAAFSLRGVTAALAAIEAHVAGRGGQ